MASKTYPTTIRLTRRQYARLRAAAAKQDRPTGRLMVLILMAWCDAHDPSSASLPAGMADKPLEEQE